MKKILFAYLFVLTSLFIQAQKDTLQVTKASMTDTASSHKPVFYKNSISINFFSFFESMFKNNVAPNLNTSFLYYTRNFKNSFVRIGVNGWNAQNTETNDQTKEKTTSNNLYSSASLAFYFNKNVSRHFSVAYGLNLIGGYIDSTRKFVTPIDKVTYYNQSYFYGLAPGIMFTYKITKHLSVFAEYMLPFKITNSKSGTKYNLFPSENSTDRTSQSFSMQIFNPPSIFLSYKF